MTSPRAGRSLRSTAVLVADLVGSTALATRIGEDAFDRVLQVHDDVAAEVVAAHRGRIVKFLGDGFVAAFAAAGDALGCAEAFQQSMTLISATAGEPVQARVGLSLGDVLETDGDLHGRPMTEAARLCAHAASGSVWCTDIAARSATGRPETDFGPTTTLTTLKGLPPLDARELQWDRAATVEWTGLAVSVLGPLQVTRNGATVDLGGPKERRVLAILAAHNGGPATLDTIVEGLWGDHPPRTATRSVHAYVARLRRALEPPRRHGAAPRVLVTEGRAYRLVLGPDALDAARFTRLVESGRHLLAEGRAAEAEAGLRSALDAWRGIPYEADLDAEPCAAESRHLLELRGLAREEHVAARLELGATGDAVPEIEALLADAPLRERAWEYLMLALFRAGRQGDALRAYQRARRVLAEELGVEPGPGLRHLEAAILAHDESLLAPRPNRREPHGGLPALLDPGTSIMAGRDTELASLRAAWERARAGRGGFVAVAGSAGTGKTRLVAALAVEAHESAGIVLYATTDPADGGPRALLRRALRSGGIDSGLLDEGFDQRPGETIAALLPDWSHDTPTLLVLEGLHDADAPTVAAIADIAEWSATLPLLVVGTFRSGDDADLPASVGAGQIALGPLPRDAVAAIALRYADDWTVDQVDALTQASGGVPVVVHRLAAERAHAAGRQRVDAAAAQAAAARRRLTATRDDLADGVAELQRLLERRRAELPVATVVGPERELPPYRGLESFAAADAADYFGREHLVAELVACVATWPLVAVIGPSGSGKSSLARAGLVPAIADGVLHGSEDWGIAIVAPGPRPLAAFAGVEGVLATRGSRLVVIDPLEELWTACTDLAEREAFVDRILDLAADPECAVVVCIRSDFIGRVAEHPALATAVGAGTLLVSEMTDVELRRAVEGPARRRGLDVEPALVDAATADVAGRPGALPLLSTALLATWERRSGPLLTVRDYRDAGGVASALADLADACYASLTPAAGEAARRILLRLAAERGGTDVRVRARVADLVTGADARAAFDTLVGRRLVIVDGDYAELTHEALLREWPRLVTWLDEDRAGRRLHRRIADATRSWSDAHHDASELYRGTRLQAAMEWAELHAAELSDDEHEFLAASAASAASEIAEAHARAAREVRRNRRLRVTLSGLAIVLIVALASTAFALRERSRADRNTTRAERQSIVSDAARLATEVAANTDQPDLMLLLAAEAYRMDPSAVTEGALGTALTRSPAGVDQAVLLDPPTRYPNVTSDGRLLAAPGNGDTVRLIDMGTGRLDRMIRTGTPTPLAPVFSTDDRLMAVGSASGVVTVWNLDSGRRVGAPIVVPGGGPAYGVFAPLDATRLLTGGHDGAVTSWQIGPDGPAVPTELFRVDPVPNPSLPLLVLASPGGLLAVGDPEAGPTTVWDGGAGRVIRVLPGRPGSIDGSREVVTSGGDGITRWDVTTGEPVAPATTGLVAAGPLASVSPDGRYVAIPDHGADVVRVLDAVTGDDAMAPVGFGWQDPIARFLGDGRLFVHGSDGAAIVRVDPTAMPAFARTLGGSNLGVGASFATSRRTVLTVDGPDGPGRVWDAVRAVETATIADPSATPGTFVLPSPDLRTTATIHAGTVRLWDRDGGPAHELPTDPSEPLDTFAWSPDGRRFVQAFETRAVVWRVRPDQPPTEVARLALLGPVDRTQGYGSYLVFSPDGNTAALVRELVGTAALYDLRSGRRISVVNALSPAASMHAATFSPDGRSFVTAFGNRLGGPGGGVQYYDVRTGLPGRRLDLPYSPNGIAFARHGSRLATLRVDAFSMPGRAGRSSLQLWEARGLRPIGIPVPIPAGAFWLGADRSGTRLVNAADASFAVVWDIAPQRWQRLACRIAGRQLTRGEWSQFLPGRPYAPVCRA